MSNTGDHKEKTVYELGYLVLPSVSEDGLSDVVNTLKGIIKKSGAEEIGSEDPIKFDLAYTMSKVVGARKYVVNEAYIGWVKFECDAACISEVNTEVKKLDEILRFLLVKAPRETTFTFAEALRAKEEKEREAEEQSEEAEQPVEKVVE